MDSADLITMTMQRVTSRGFNPRTSLWEHKVCVMLHAAQGIIDNGGFEYFFASTWPENPEMDDFSRVFEAVGATSSANAVREALARAKSPSPVFDDLNKLLWNESERNYALLEQYIKLHESSYA